MPAPGKMALVHDAVLWRRIGTDDNSRPIVSNAPEEIKCRWDRTRRISYAADQTPIAVTITATLDREVEVGSALWKGKIDDLPGTGQTPTIDVMEVVSCDPVDDIRGQHTTWEAGLTRSSDSLHTAATEDETP